jgi:pyridoxal 5'-phosphate synthase pdxT subunit
MEVGVLALQGGFDLHARRLQDLGATPKLIKQSQELDQVSALIIPGGESTTLLKLLDQEMKDKLIALAKERLPILTTCAGTILAAKAVRNPEQESLAIIDIVVERNSYGRQIDSFTSTDLRSSAKLNVSEMEAVFIRAPRIVETAKDVEILARYNNEPVLVRQNSVIAATFHPELSPSAKVIHQLFLNDLSA